MHFGTAHCLMFCLFTYSTPHFWLAAESPGHRMLQLASGSTAVTEVKAGWYLLLECNLWLMISDKQEARYLHSDSFSHRIEASCRKTVWKQRSSPTYFLQSMWRRRMLHLFRSSSKTPAVEGLSGNKRNQSGRNGWMRCTKRFNWELEKMWYKSKPN